MILEQAKKGLENKDFQVSIDNGCLYLIVEDTYFELSEFEVKFQASEFLRLEEEELENFKD